MPLIQIGIVDTTGNVDTHLIQETAAAINVQVIQDLPQFWNIQATVLALPDPNRIPAAVWPVQLVESLPPGEGGFHSTDHNQPFAKVIATPDSNDWTVDASHEILEMLVDPSGNRLQSALAMTVKDGTIQDASGQFEYLVEACDPCEANDFAYSIQGIAVSDFLTPHFYDSSAVAGTRYSFRNNIKAPRQILPGGYISWIDPVQNLVQQIQFLDPNSPPELVTLGSADQILGQRRGISLREWIDNLMSTESREHKRPNQKLSKHCSDHRAALATFALAKAKCYTDVRKSTK